MGMESMTQPSATHCSIVCPMFTGVRDTWPHSTVLVDSTRTMGVSIYTKKKNGISILSMFLCSDESFLVSCVSCYKFYPCNSGMTKFFFSFFFSYIK